MYTNGHMLKLLHQFLDTANLQTPSKTYFFFSFASVGENLASINTCS